MTDEALPVATTSNDYAVVHRESDGTRLVLRYRDVGIRLTPTGLEWSTGGEARSAAYGEIVSIRLAVGSLPQSGSFGICTVTFRSGMVLTAVGITSLGRPSPEKAGIYAAFIRDLHARLAADDRARIQFLAGNTQGRQRVQLGIMIVAAAFFVAMPIVLLIITGDVRSLAVLLFGVFFVGPPLKTFRRNASRTYSPDALPEDLLP